MVDDIRVMMLYSLGMARITDDKEIQLKRHKVTSVRIQTLQKTKAGWKVNYDHTIDKTGKDEDAEVL